MDSYRNYNHRNCTITETVKHFNKRLTKHQENKKDDNNIMTTKLKSRDNYEGNI